MSSRRMQEIKVAIGFIPRALKKQLGELDYRFHGGPGEHQRAVQGVALGLHYVRHGLGTQPRPQRRTETAHDRDPIGA